MLKQIKADIPEILDTEYLSFEFLRLIMGQNLKYQKILMKILKTPHFISQQMII